MRTPTKRKWIQRAVKRSGSLTRRAQRHGKSVHSEAVAESHSSDPKLRGAGNLALRFQGKAKRGNIRKPKRTTSGRIR